MQDKEKAKVYWQYYLSDVSVQRIDLGTSHQIQHNALVGVTYEVPLLINETLTQSLQILAKAWGVTLNTLFQGVWALLVGRYSASDEAIFGITVSGRSNTLSHIESMVGLFINTLPLRARLAPELLFSHCVSSYNWIHG